MKVYLLILFCACINIVKADTDSDEAKYIDLLPEEEKQEFLNRIARRILGEIRSRGNLGKSSIEISDEKLNENDAYVQKIMEEESESIKNERRLGVDGLKNENLKEDDNVDIRVKPLPENQFNGQENQENSEITELTAYEMKKRMKKDTPENNERISDENIAFNRDTVSDIPVHVIYDDDKNSNNVVKSSNFNNDNIAVSEDNNKDVSEKQNSQDGLHNESKKSDITDMRKSNSNINLEGNIENKGIVSIPQTSSNDFDLQQEDFVERNAMIPNDNGKKSSTEAENLETVKEYTQRDGADDYLEMKYRENATKNNLDTRPSMKELKNVTVDSNQLIIGLTTDASNVLNTNSLSIQNNVSTSGGIIRNEVNIGKIKSQPFLNNTKEYFNNNDLLDEKVNPEIENQTNKIGIHHNKNFTKNDNLETYIASNKDDLIEGNFEGNDFSNDKTVLRKKIQLNEDSAEDAEHASSEEIIVKTNNSNTFPSLNTHSMSDSYKVYEIHNKYPPFVTSEQKSNGKFVDEPFYAPVYNYAPSNAFYSAYNRFGPNFKENYRVIQNVGSFENEKSYEKNQLNNYLDYTRSHSLEKNIQRNFELNAHKSNLKPFSKEFTDMNFNPYEYLDMDYYFGRISNKPGSIYNDFTNENSQNLPPEHISKDLLWKDSSEDVIDPDPIVDKYNIKDKIRKIRNILYLQKYGKDVVVKRTLDKKRREGNTQFRNKNQYLLDSSSKGNDQTKFVWIPGIPKKKENNVAVDYYFSRMNEEEPLLHNIKPNIYLGDGKNTLKIEKRSKNEMKPVFKNIKVLEEKRLQMPFKSDNMLKIDLAMTDGKNMNIIFRKVKRPERNEFRAYLYACLNVLKDMIEHNNKGLLGYNWLGSTVDLQSAIWKLLDLTNNLKEPSDVHYSDVELFKYIVYLFKSSNTRLEEAKRELSYKTRSGNQIEKRTVKRKMLLPRNGNKKVGEKIDKPLERWLQLYKNIRHSNSIIEIDVLLEFEDFLTDLQESLYEVGM
ncbi:unnamed protein product [Parnassius apollo]|uniref:(apollo) hypothetical protein n=1 Tax=Parnassius apollo TaxID=110799 RepID=A0A8S3WDP5_PARAO|nr:unnamed protein product [Parnassius apollo]